MSRAATMHAVHLKDIDLNLLRLFDAVFRTSNVSRAAQLLDLTQPAARQGLTPLGAAAAGPAPAGGQPGPDTLAGRVARPALHARRGRRAAHAQGEAAGRAGA